MARVVLLPFSIPGIADALTDPAQELTTMSGNLGDGVTRTKD
ncbi:hypothetical protein BH09MYX1_BH09MYX1_17580 [soil metagenome]